MINNKTLPFYIGLRYSFSKRRNRFISVVSMISMLGMALGIASLIVVLSVMNGLSAELTDRILSVVPHGFVQSKQGLMQNWRSHQQQVLSVSGIEAAAPYIKSNALLKTDFANNGVQLTAIDPVAEATVSKIARSMVAGDLRQLEQQKFSIVLGGIVARSLGVNVGDTVTLVIPELRITPAGVKPRSRRFTVVGIFEVGAQLDASQVFISLESGQKLFALGDAIHGLRLKVEDLFAARKTLQALASDYHFQDWSQTQGSLFQAMKMEKILITVLLFSVIAVAAFNIVSTLTMAVAEKRADIAVLRTMGASRRLVATAFLVQGLFLALVGVLSGGGLGILVASYIADIIAILEALAGSQVFDPSIYFISEIPSDIKNSDLLVIGSVALIMSLLAACYPAYRAASIAPAEVLRYE